MRHDEIQQRSKNALQQLESTLLTRRDAAIERATGTVVKLYFAGKAVADAPDIASPGSRTYVPATVTGWRWMQTELLIPYHFTDSQIRQLQNRGVIFEIHDAETDSWQRL